MSKNNSYEIKQVYQTSDGRTFGTLGEAKLWNRKDQIAQIIFELNGAMNNTMAIDEVATTLLENAERFKELLAIDQEITEIGSSYVFEAPKEFTPEPKSIPSQEEIKVMLEAVKNRDDVTNAHMLTDELMEYVQSVGFIEPDDQNAPVLTQSGSDWLNNATYLVSVENIQTFQAEKKKKVIGPGNPLVGAVLNNFLISFMNGKISRNQAAIESAERQGYIAYTPLGSALPYEMTPWGLNYYNSLKNKANHGGNPRIIRALRASKNNGSSAGNTNTP